MATEESQDDPTRLKTKQIIDSNPQATTDPGLAPGQNAPVTSNAAETAFSPAAATVNTNVSPPLQQNTPKPPKKKHRFIKFLIFVCVFCLIVVGILKVINIYDNYTYNKNLLELVKLEPDVDIKLTSEELSQDTDEDGIINSKELELGLDLIDPDTDGDGLNDIDEINVHHSDPKKYSTSGDIFGDGYKIQNNIDIGSVYKEDLVIKTENENITLFVKRAQDMEAVYKLYDGSIPSGYVLAESIKPFRVYSFGGNAKINISEPNDYEVISYDNINKVASKAKYKREKSSISIEIQNDNPLLIVYTKSAIKRLFDNASIAQSDAAGSYNIDSDYIVIAFPILNVLSNVPIYIFESDNTGLKTENKALVNEINTKIDEESIKYNKENNKTSSYKPLIKHVHVHGFAIKMLDIIFNKIFGQSSNESDSTSSSWTNLIFLYRHLHGKQNLFNFFFGYSDKEGKQDIPQAIINDDKYQNTSGEIYADSGFSVSENAFRFENLSTEESEGGVCAGFAGVTTKIFNNSPIGRADENDNFTYTTTSYDLTPGEYDDIFNKLLYKYEPTSEGLITYSDDIKGNVKLDSSKMPVFDNQVVKLLNFYYTKENNGRFVSGFKRKMDLKNGIKTPIPGDTINKVVEIFKSGKIVTVSMKGGPGGHAINAYKIAQDKNNPDILYIKVYDSNLPNDMSWANIKDDNDNSKKKYDTTITLKRFYKRNMFGKEVEYYNFDYSPFGKDRSYSWGDIDKTDIDNLRFFDENNTMIK